MPVLPFPPRAFRGCDALSHQALPKVTLLIRKGANKARAWMAVEGRLAPDTVTG